MVSIISVETNHFVRIEYAKIKDGNFTLRFYEYDFWVMFGVSRVGTRRRVVIDEIDSSFDDDAPSVYSVKIYRFCGRRKTPDISFYSRQ